MGRRILQYRYGTPPYSYVWLLDTEAPPAGDAVVVDSVDGNLIEIKQERKTTGHYVLTPLVISVPVGKTRYADWVVPDYTNGMDILSCKFPTNNLEDGDEIVAGKILLGKIGATAADAVAGDTTIKVASIEGVLRTTLLGGALDEGFMLSFGTDDATDDDLNAEPPTKDEKPMVEIKRLGTEQKLGGGAAMVELTLFSGLPADVAAGTAVNLIVAFVKDPVPLSTNGVIDFGGETLTAANLPAGKRLRVGFMNKGTVDKTIRAMMATLY